VSLALVPAIVASPVVRVPPELDVFSPGVNKTIPSLTQLGEDIVSGTRVTQVFFTPSGRLITVLPERSEIVAWQVEREPAAQARAGALDVDVFVTTAVSSDGRFLATKGADRHLLLYDLEDDAFEVSTFAEDMTFETLLGVTIDGRVAVQGSTHGLRLIDPRSQRVTNVTSEVDLVGDEVVLSPRGDALYVLGHGVLTAHRLPGFDQAWSGEVTAGTFPELVIDPTGRYLATLGQGCSIWSTHGGASIATPFGEEDQSWTHAAFAPSGRTLFVEGSGRIMRYEILDGGRMKMTAAIDTQSMTGFAVHPSGMSIAVLGLDDVVRLFRAQ
jgi:WD40 repeat protein